MNFASRLGSGPPVLLDGPMGTELDRRGVGTELPLWSAWGLLRAADQVEAIHRDYLSAGAEVLTANTFRTHRRSLEKAEFGDRATELTTLAVRLARDVGSGRSKRAWIAGSMAPLEDCYSPEQTPPDDELAVEHGEMALHLAVAGVDLILVETMPTAREARAATSAAVATGRPVLTGFACDSRGRLLSGESIAAAVALVEPAGPAGFMINCAPTPTLGTALERLRAATDLPIAAYGNVGHAEAARGWTTVEPIDPAEYVEYARAWIDTGARMIGTCCGTTPAHTRALASMMG